jgi:D-alanyl-D-alanine carboxypeptidase/D-alanyl-D-alanine-endopeptidase (penicillin-binding protein 4)
MKLLTTSAALEYLGQDFKYKTNIEANGSVSSSGELEGDIIIRGSGDPNLSGRFYNGNITAVPDSWARALRDRGIKKISGDIIADDTIFDRDYINPSWPKNQLAEWYCAPSCGLSFNDNCVDITVCPEKKPGSVVTLLVEPDTSYININNTCIYTANKKEHGYSLERKQGTNQIFIKGKFWIGASPQKNWVSVHNPALYLATVFRESLKRIGISVSGGVRLIKEGEITDDNPDVIVQTVSTLEQTVIATNKQSQNFYAEQLLKTLGAQVKGRGTSQAGIEVLYEFVDKLGFNRTECFVEDGSGLSRGNKLSPKFITTLLTYMSKQPYGKVFFDSLPVAGYDGGMRKRVTASQYKDKIRAKTGFIANTSALSGYVNASDGDMLAFSILMNNFKDLHAVQKIQDNICRVLADNCN